MPALEEILPGLHRWTAQVPDWTPDQGGPEGWAEEVACVAWEGEDALVLVDPLVNGDDWAEIDALVESRGEAVELVTTCPWHARSGGEVVRRYGNSPGVTSYAYEPAVRRDKRITHEVTHSLSGEQARVSGGITAFATDPPQGEITLYIEPIRTVIAGDVLIGAEGERTETLRVCPQAWLDPVNTVESVKAALRPLLVREIDSIVPLHGAPVLDGAKDALQNALYEA